MKIYTKTGDKGQTSLIGGTRVPKHHIRIEAYGTVDELNSWIGILRSSMKDRHAIEVLAEIQDRLFTIGSLLAADPARSKMKLPELIPSDWELLEKEIDQMNESLPEMRSFILPGGTVLSAQCHVARCICRKAERRATALSETDVIDEKIIIYLNRLSDYLFVFARKMNQESGMEDLPWKARV
jgi:cob(I)alamin adenosyltransferase